MFPAFVIDFLNEMNQQGDFWVVGGSCRDALLGREPHDFDFVTTTPHLLEGKFPQIGKDFPVYLVKFQEHRFEIAATRTERKTGVRHSDFQCQLTSSLQEDLLRRDLTVNAFAWRPEDGFVATPTGIQDLEGECLRHVTEAFSEDVLRVLRVARFSASLGWEVHPETLSLCKSLSNQMKHLSAERVQAEFFKAMKSPFPWKFFEVLRDCDCLSFWFPEIQALVGCEQNPTHHPEGDVFTHTMLTLQKTVELGGDFLPRLGALVHDFGKPLVVEFNEDGRFFNHDERGPEAIKSFGERLLFSSKTIASLCFVAERHHKVHECHNLRPGKLVELLKRANRSLLGLEGLLQVCQADHQGRGPITDPYPQTDFMKEANQVLSKVDLKGIENITPEKVRNLQNHALASWKKNGQN